MVLRYCSIQAESKVPFIVYSRKLLHAAAIKYEKKRQGADLGDEMRKIFSVGILAIALTAATSITSVDRAYADNNFWKGLGIGIGAAIVGGAIVNAVRAGQRHCHEGQTYYCHSHAYANAYHYHDFPAGPILYQQVAAPPPPPVGQIVLPQAHVTWCYNHYRSYDLNTNSFQPFQGPRRPCISPYYQ